MEFFREKKCEWAASVIPTLGANLIQAITNALWVVDGHHKVFANQGFSLPFFATKFVNYNRLEMSKHRKSQPQNKSWSKLNLVSSHILTACKHITGEKNIGLCSKLR